MKVNEVKYKVIDCGAIKEEDFAVAIREGNEEKFLTDLFGSLLIFHFGQIPYDDFREEDRKFKEMMKEFTEEVRMKISGKCLSVSHEFSDFLLTIHSVQDNLVLQVVRMGGE